MDTAQFGTLIATIAGAGVAIAGAIRWGMRRIVKSQDDSTAALLENARSHADLAAKVEAMHAAIERVVHILLGIPRPSEDSKQRRARIKTRPEGSPVHPLRRPPDDDDSGDYGG